MRASGPITDVAAQSAGRPSRIAVPALVHRRAGRAGAGSRGPVGSLRGVPGSHTPALSRAALEQLRHTVEETFAELAAAWEWRQQRPRGRGRTSRGTRGPSTGTRWNRWAHRRPGLALRVKREPVPRARVARAGQGIRRRRKHCQRCIYGAHRAQPAHLAGQPGGRRYFESSAVSSPSTPFTPRPANST
jgi:hypothetical protein